MDPEVRERLDQQDKEIKELKEAIASLTIELRKKKWNDFIRAKSV